MASYLRLPGDRVDLAGSTTHARVDAKLCGRHSVLLYSRVRRATDTRVADVRFVLDALPGLPRRLSRKLDLSRIGIFGYSMGGGRHSRSTDPTWSSFWTHQRGWTQESLLSAGGHGSFGDYQFALPGLARASGTPPEALTEELGTVDPESAVSSTRRALSGFFGRFLKP